MNKPNHVKYLSYIDSSIYIDFIKDNDILFSKNDNHDREKYFNACKTFFLLEEFNINDPILLEKFFDVSKELTNILNLKYGIGTLFNIQFSLLEPKSEIKKHYDDGLLFTLSNRIHLPLCTNNEVLFYLGDRKFNLKINQLVEINNKKIHSVINNSDQPRIHLILDYLPLRYTKYLD